MNKKHFFTIAVLMVFILSISSCKSKEEKIISRLEKLSEHIDKNQQDFDTDDWADAFEELEDIHEDMEDCEFTREEIKEVGRAYGRLTMVIAKEGSKSLGHEASVFLKDFSTFVKGFQEGTQENFHKKDFNDVEKQITNTLKDIENEWKE